MSDLIKILSQANDLNEMVQAQPAYNEFRAWQLSCQAGRLVPIRESVLDTIAQSEKSAMSFALDQLHFLADDQKDVLKHLHESQVDDYVQNLKHELTAKGLLK